MKKLLCPKIPDTKQWVKLDPVEAHHATRVMRLREGQLVHALDGNGGEGQVILRVRGEDRDSQNRRHSSRRQDPYGRRHLVTLHRGVC